MFMPGKTAAGCGNWGTYTKRAGGAGAHQSETIFVLYFSPRGPWVCMLDLDNGTLVDVGAWPVQGGYAETPEGTVCLNDSCGMLMGHAYALYGDLGLGPHLGPVQTNQDGHAAITYEAAKTAAGCGAKPLKMPRTAAGSIYGMTYGPSPLQFPIASELHHFPPPQVMIDDARQAMREEFYDPFNEYAGVSIQPVGDQPVAGRFPTEVHTAPPRHAPRFGKEVRREHDAQRIAMDARLLESTIQEVKQFVDPPRRHSAAGVYIPTGMPIPPEPGVFGQHQRYVQGPGRTAGGVSQYEAGFLAGQASCPKTTPVNGISFQHHAWPPSGHTQEWYDGWGAACSEQAQKVANVAPYVQGPGGGRPSGSTFPQRHAAGANLDPAKVAIVERGIWPAFSNNETDEIDWTQLQVGEYQIMVTNEPLAVSGLRLPTNMVESIEIANALHALPITNAVSDARWHAADHVEAFGGGLADPRGAVINDPGQVIAWNEQHPQSGHFSDGYWKETVLAVGLKEHGVGALAQFGGRKNTSADSPTVQEGLPGAHNENYKDYSNTPTYMGRIALKNGVQVDLLDELAAGGPLGGPIPAWLVAKFRGAQ